MSWFPSQSLEIWQVRLIVYKIRLFSGLKFKKLLHEWVRYRNNVTPMTVLLTFCFVIGFFNLFFSVDRNQRLLESLKFSLRLWISSHFQTAGVEEQLFSYQPLQPWSLKNFKFMWAPAVKRISSLSRIVSLSISDDGLEFHQSSILGVSEFMKFAPTTRKSTICYRIDHLDKPVTNF